MSLGGPSGPSLTPARASRPLVALMVAGGVFLILVLIVAAAGALGIGPFAGAPGTPAPSTVARGSDAPTTLQEPTESGLPTRTSGRTSDPGGGPTQRPRPSSTARLPASPGTALGELFSHVPSDIWSTCSSGDADEVRLASVDCTARDGQLALSYAAYVSNEELYVAYNEYFHATEIEADSGRCYEPGDGGGIRATPNRWPAEHPYSVGEQPVGRYVCLQMDGEPVIAWTDDRFNILAVGRSGAADIDRFVTYWLNEAGPVP